MNEIVTVGLDDYVKLDWVKEQCIKLAKENKVSGNYRKAMNDLIKILEEKK